MTEGSLKCISEYNLAILAAILNMYMNQICIFLGVTKAETYEDLRLFQSNL